MTVLSHPALDQLPRDRKSDFKVIFSNFRKLELIMMLDIFTAQKASMRKAASDIGIVQSTQIGLIVLPSLCLECLCNFTFAREK